MVMVPIKILSKIQMKSIAITETVHVHLQLIVVEVCYVTESLKLKL